jgi:C-terminal peptidase prc
MRQAVRGLLGLVVALAPLAFAQQSRDCSVLGQNVFVRDTLQDIYFWYRDLRPLDPALADSPEGYLEAVRARPLDESFSYIAPKAADQAFFSNSQFVGLGLSTRLVRDGELRVTDVFPDSPAAEAGLVRGDRVLAIGGRTIAELQARGELGTAFGPSEAGLAVELLFRHADGGELRATLVKRAVTIPTVSLTRVYDVGGRKVGYVVFRNFVQPSYAALLQAFLQLRSEGATELVLDLRYNGGGLVAVARYLAGLIGGAGTSGQVFCEFFHNDKNEFRNEVLRFEDPPGALDFTRLTVITTRASASASELVINALRPFMQVHVVGDTTFGKPVGQYSFDFCDKVLHPVAFTLRNAHGQGDFFGGFAPDCAAADDLDHAFGDPAEASLAEALHVATTGACSPAASRLARTHTRPAPRVRESGWQQLVGAH